MHGLRACTFIIMTGLASLGAVVLPGCATRPPEFSEAWQQAQHDVLKQRAEARWAALIDGDFDRAYMFTTPEYRSVVSAQQYRGKYGRVVDWRVAHVKEVSYDDPAVATVAVELAYRVALPGTGGKVVETQSLLSEKWIYKHREWWYTAN